MKKVIVLTLVVLLMIFGVVRYDEMPYQASETGTIELRMSQTSSETGAIGQAMDKFAEEIYERTDGRYKINTFHNGQLGGERDNIEGCQMGTIDIAVVNQAPLANFVPEIGALDIPYLISGTEHADNIFLGEIGDYLLNELDKTGIYGLSIWESGFRNLTNSKREVNSLEDVAGLRVRTMENKVHQEFWRDLGSDPVPMAWSEAYTALQQGAIDGQENPSSVILTNNVAEVNKNMAITEHAYSTVFLIMSPKAWNSLSEKDQKIFLETAKDMGILGRELNRSMEQEALAELEKAGMKITFPDKQEFIEASSDFRKVYEEKYGSIINRIDEVNPLNALN